MTDQAPRIRRRWSRILGLVLAIASVPVLVAWAHTAVMSFGRAYSASDVPDRDVALVLGAKADQGRPSAFLAARLDIAVDLYERGKVHAILVSGDNRAVAHHETDVMRAYLEARGVPADRIVADPSGFDTYDSCIRASYVFTTISVTVVTQDYHLARALTVCRTVGVDAVGVGDASMLGRFPYNWVKGAVRELPAYLKMEADLLIGRIPQDPPVSTLQEILED